MSLSPHILIQYTLFNQTVTWQAVSILLLIYTIYSWPIKSNTNLVPVSLTRTMHEDTSWLLCFYWMFYTMLALITPPYLLLYSHFSQVTSLYRLWLEYPCTITVWFPGTHLRLLTAWTMIWVLRWAKVYQGVWGGDSAYKLSVCAMYRVLLINSGGYNLVGLRPLFVAVCGPPPASHCGARQCTSGIYKGQKREFLYRNTIKCSRKGYIMYNYVIIIIV